MKIKLSSVLVQDQEKALRFYTDTLGLVLRADLPMGGPRWLTVVSPEAPEEVELLLEPNGNPAAAAFQKAMFEQGIPLTAFLVEDIQAEYARLRGLGVTFRSEPTEAGPATIAIFDDTCGNFIQIYQLQS